MLRAGSNARRLSRRAGPLRQAQGATTRNGSSIARRSFEAIGAKNERGPQSEKTLASNCNQSVWSERQQWRYRACAFSRRCEKCGLAAAFFFDAPGRAHLLCGARAHLVREISPCLDMDIWRQERSTDHRSQSRSLGPRGAADLFARQGDSPRGRCETDISILNDTIVLHSAQITPR